MPAVVLFVVLLLATCQTFAQEVSVLVNPPMTSAQEHADYLAATGSFGHCGRRGGCYEGLWFSTVSPVAAIKRSCFWGTRKVKEVATAWCPKRRGWVAVVRYY